MRYFAMIEGERRGPFELDKLAEAGVRPDTYVWCKGMDDWQKAEDVADICRMFRIRIHDLMHPGSVDAINRINNLQTLPAPLQQPAQTPSRFGRFLQQADLPDLPSVEEIEKRRDNDVPPANMLPWAIISTVFFFPFTGIAAIMSAIKSKRAWSDSLAGGNEDREASSADLRKLAHDYCQAAKLWTGVSFFLGLILYSFLLRFL